MLLVCLSTVVMAATDHGSQRVLSLKKTCEVTVPADWRIDQWISSDAAAPDHSASVAIDSNTGAASLAAIKPLAQSMFKPLRVFEDGPQRLWYAYRGASANGTSWYVGVPGQIGVCTAQINFRSGDQADLARRIVMSVRPASDQWPHTRR